jgi:hypothetical protein
MKTALLITGMVSALCATSALAASDHFNRTTLGNSWVVPSGSLFIVSDRLQGDTLSLGYDKKSRADTSVQAVIYTTSTDLEYGAVASGKIATGDNAFVKIQAQTGDGNFSNAGFYTGNNVGGEFFALTSEVPSPATLSVSFCGTVATMKIRSAVHTQVYNYDYGATFHTGGGLGTYGSVALDNYKSSPGGCALSERGIWIKKGASHVRDLSLTK